MKGNQWPLVVFTVLVQLAVGLFLVSGVVHYFLLSRFDANTYLRILDAWQTFDLLGDAGTDSYCSLFSRCGDQKYLVFSIDSDVCYYPEEQRALAEELKQAGVPQRRITVHSDKGHDSFLLEPELFTPHLAHALEKAW